MPAATAAAGPSSVRCVLLRCRSAAAAAAAAAAADPPPRRAAPPAAPALADPVDEIDVDASGHSGSASRALGGTVAFLGYRRDEGVAVLGRRDGGDGDGDGDGDDGDGDGGGSPPIDLPPNPNRLPPPLDGLRARGDLLLLRVGEGGDEDADSSVGDVSIGEDMFLDFTREDYLRFVAAAAADPGRAAAADEPNDAGEPVPLAIKYETRATTRKPLAPDKPSPSQSPALSNPKREWEERFDELRRFRERNGHCNVPSDGGALDGWIAYQRFCNQLRQEGKPSSLTEENWRRLEDLGFEWDERQGGGRLDALSRCVRATPAVGAAPLPTPTSPHELDVQQGVEVEVEGVMHGVVLNAARKYPASDAPPTNLRTTTPKDDLHWDNDFEEMEQTQLRCRGKRDWASRWKDRLEELRCFREHNRHCNVPQSPGALGAWVNTQRMM